MGDLVAEDVVIAGLTIGKCRDMDWTDADNIIIENFEPTVESGLPRTTCLTFDVFTGEFKDASRSDSPTWKLTITGVQKL